jgi:hypothetical protein
VAPLSGTLPTANGPTVQLEATFSQEPAQNLAIRGSKAGVHRASIFRLNLRFLDCRVCHVAYSRIEARGRVALDGDAGPRAAGGPRADVGEVMLLMRPRR